MAMLSLVPLILVFRINLKWGISDLGTTHTSFNLLKQLILFDAISITLVDQIPSSPSSACRLSSVFFGRRTDRGDHRNVDDDAYLNRHGQALAKRH